MEKEAKLVEDYLSCVSINKRRRCCSHAVPEMNLSKSELDTSGYIPFERRMEELFTSGQALIDARSEQYDFDIEFDKNGNPILTAEQEAFHDPTRGPNFDMADAFQMHIEADQRLDEVVDVVKERAQAAEKASINAQLEKKAQNAQSVKKESE